MSGDIFAAPGATVVVQFQGTLSSSAAGTIGAFVAENAAAAANTDGTRSQFTDAGAPVIAAKSRLRITASATPSHVGLIAFVTSLNAGDAHNPYTTQWTTGGADPLYNAASINPSNGDSYVVDTLLTTTGVLRCQLTCLGNVGELRFVDLEVHPADALGIAHRLNGNQEAEFGRGVVLYRCRTAATVKTEFEQSALTAVCTQFSGATTFTRSLLECSGCVFEGNVNAYFGLLRFSTLTNAFRGASIVLRDDALAISSGNLSWTDSVGGIAISLTHGADWQQGTGHLWGAGNTFADGVSVDAGSGLYYPAGFVAGVNIPATAQFRVNGTNYAQSDLPVFDGMANAGIVAGS